MAKPKYIYLMFLKKKLELPFCDDAMKAEKE